MADFSSIRGLAFDLDGTLVDSAPGLAAAIDMALAEMGLPQAGEARVGTWIGNGADVLVLEQLNAPGFLMCNDEGLWITEDATHRARLLLLDRTGSLQR